MATFNLDEQIKEIDGRPRVIRRRISSSFTTASSPLADVQQALLFVLLLLGLLLPTYLSLAYYKIRLARNDRRLIEIYSTQRQKRL